MSELKKEFKSFMQDLEQNIKNKEDLDYVKGRTTEFMNAVLEQLEHVLDYKEGKISQIEKIQSDLEEKVSSIEKEIAELEEDIYIEDIEDEELDYENEEEDEENSDYDLEIVCPYCDYEFLIDLNQENSEVQCPQCDNIIELDWSGNSEDAEDSPNTDCEGGHCSNCPGCNLDEEDDDEDM